MQKRYSIIFIFLLAIAAFYPAASANLVYSQNTADLNKIEDYLNGLKSLRAGFVQASTNGTSAEGRLYMARPNRLRFVYADPSPIQLIADGKSLIYYDSRLQQVTYSSIKSSPLAPILKETVSLNDPKIILTDFKKSGGEISVSFIDAKDPASGQVTLQFNEQPLELKRWIVRDAQDIITTLSLIDIQTNTDIDPKLFKFDDPRPLNQRLE